MAGVWQTTEEEEEVVEGADMQKFTHSRQTGHLRWSAQPDARLDIAFSLKKHCEC